MSWMNPRRDWYLRGLHAIFALLLVDGGAARADYFHLIEGGRIEGEVVSETEETYTIRTAMGVFDIEKARVVERVISVSPWARYEAEKSKHPDTADGHFAMAQWCRRNGLRADQKTHLTRAIELDPNHADARSALGYVLQDGRWVLPQKKRARKPSDDELEARRKARRDEELVRKAVAEWTVKIQAIYRGRLEGEPSVSEKFRDGRRQILEVRDPLAIPGLARTLAQGKASTRRLLVESMSQFDEAEATMNLIVIAVLDRAPQVRLAAARALDARKSEQVIGELRGALATEEEFVLRNAASALGVLRAKEAVEDLIPLLSTTTHQKVRVALPVYLDSVYDTFGYGCRYRYGGRSVYYRPSFIGVIGPAYPMGTMYYDQVQTVSVHRTEVQEALIAITGVNHGFDESAWWDWFNRNREKPAP